MSDTPQNTRRDGAAGPSGTGLSQSGDLSGISEMFGLRDGQQAESGTRIGTDTVGRWAAATEAAAQPPDISGRVVQGRYRLIAELGVGGMGVTYRAWDTKAGIPVVVKMPRREVRQDSEAMQRFAREIDAMLAVPHERIVPITDHGDDDGCPFVVMRFLPGGSLADYRRRDEAGNAIKNPPGMLHFWLPGVAAALDHIHSKGMLHRDVKPGNIFLDGFLKPYLGDFGIAKVVDESGGLQKEQTLTATKMAVGTPEYMAPELFKPRSKPDGRVDQYALAVTVYEMLSGEKPFKGDRAHIIVEHSGLPVPPLSGKVPGLPQTLCLAVEKGLAKKSEERFATCREFAAAVVSELAVLPPESDTVRLLCPSCKNILKLPQKAAGGTGKCPRCQAAMDVAADLGSLWLESEERGTASQSHQFSIDQVKDVPVKRSGSFAEAAGVFLMGLLGVPLTVFVIAIALSSMLGLGSPLSVIAVTCVFMAWPLMAITCARGLARWVHREHGTPVAMRAGFCLWGAALFVLSTGLLPLSHFEAPWSHRTDTGVFVGWSFILNSVATYITFWGLPLSGGAVVPIQRWTRIAAMLVAAILLAASVPSLFFGTSRIKINQEESPETEEQEMSNPTSAASPLDGLDKLPMPKPKKRPPR